MPPIRLFIDPPQAGDWNMAVDELLLESASQGQATLRFYQWNPATLSLGYFQDVAQREQHSASRSRSLIRRASGGGAIVHDHELTYSFAMPIERRFEAGIEALYYTFHETLLEALAEWGVHGKLCDPDATLQLGQREPFLCFQRRARGDVLLGEHKICGSAQRRHRGAVLQHGSVLLRRSAFAPELLGIAEISGTVVDCRPLVDAWLPRLEGRWKCNLAEAEWALAERSGAEAIRVAKFGAEKWLHRRSAAP